MSDDDCCLTKANANYTYGKLKDALHCDVELLSKLKANVGSLIYIGQYKDCFEEGVRHMFAH